MALVIGHKRREGVKIIGNGLSLDLIIRDFRGPKDKREVLIELLGLEESKFLILDTNNFYEITDNLRVRASNSSPNSHSVRLCYEAPQEYKIERTYYKF